MRNLLVDTDILIDFLRGKTAAKEFLMSALPDGVIYCSTITVAEIYAGMKDPEREKTSRLIDSLNVVDVTREIAEKAGKYKRDIKAQALELDDCLIAATSFALRAVLATGNGKHYPMPDIKKEILVLR